jgi:hypothetical protein
MRDHGVRVLMCAQKPRTQSENVPIGCNVFGPQTGGDECAFRDAGLTTKGAAGWSKLDPLA